MGNKIKRIIINKLVIFFQRIFIQILDIKLFFISELDFLVYDQNKNLKLYYLVYYNRKDFIFV